ncbi:MAG: serine/threonine protein kinase [Acidimicrobiia bacterium]|nr:serine/threonine protein kinase [Acidimicrobiia bacterium]
MQMNRAAWAIVLSTLSVASLAAENWPQFRGTQGGVASDSPSLPATWSRTENVVWRVQIPGRSWSSPVVWGDHVFVTSVVNLKTPVEPLKPASEYRGRSWNGPLDEKSIATTADAHQWMLYDVDFATGRIRWERILQTAVPAQPVHQKNTYFSETPVTDGERVYVYSASIGIFAFDMVGTLVWSKPMTPAKTRGGWGAASSPALHHGRLYVVNDNEERSYLAAYETNDGREVWRIDRDERTNWSTPLIWENTLRTEIVTTGTGRVRSYDMNGRPLWDIARMSVLTVPTPLARHGLLFVSAGYIQDTNRPVYAVRPGATGDISLKPGERQNDYIAWSHPQTSSYQPSPIVVGDYYYTLLDRGFLTCHDARTGREIYGRQRISAESSGFTASPWSYNGKIFALSEDGDTFVIQAGPEFKLLGKNSLDEMSMATPAVANESLILRTANTLYRITSASR